MGVRQQVFRRYNGTERFFLRDLRGDSIKGKHKALHPKEYLRVLQSSKFCLAPSGMGFSTRTYESIAQGCVPLIIQDEPVSNTTVVQAFDELLPWERFSLRLWQRDIPNLPTLLADFPDERWRELRRNLACAWPRVLWLQADNEAPGTQRAQDVLKANATASLGAQSFLSGYDAFESLIHTLGQRTARRKQGTYRLSLDELQGWKRPDSQFEWRTPSTSCKEVQGTAVQASRPLSERP